MEEKGIEFEEEEFEEIISACRTEGFNEERAQFDEDCLHFVEWKLGFGAWNLTNENLNRNPVWVQFSKYSPEELKAMRLLLNRMFEVCDACVKYGLKAIAFDAEQTYVAVTGKHLIEQINTL